MDRRGFIACDLKMVSDGNDVNENREQLDTELGLNWVFYV